MHISELDNFQLSDTVKFHSQLNPGLWDKSEHLHPEVRKKLLAIAADFQEFLGIDDLEVKDITVSGSNAAYNYTPTSDIDLHLVVAKPQMADQVYQELFNAKKYQYNDSHNIKIRGADVELYVQPADQPHVSQGVYSVRDGRWLRVPRRVKANIDMSCVRSKAEDLDHRITSAMASDNAEAQQRLWDKIKTMRQTGLEQHGEFGCENLVFKMLRAQGRLAELKNSIARQRDQELSLAEKSAPQARKLWGFGGYVQEGHQGQPYSSEDGVAPTTQMFLNETDDDEQTVRDFIKHTIKMLGIQRQPKIFLHRDDDWAVDQQSFGMYQPESHELHVNLAGRHLMDILRTTAHELVHCRQHEIEPMPDSAGDTGSPWENQAHAMAGVIMRKWADRHPEMFDCGVMEASGYIPTRAQANDPRFSMALTQDIRPGETGRQANKMKLKTDSQGRPGLLMKTANLQEARIKDLNDPPGPEFKPTMPRGTVRVDVSDMYDWYKLGKNIANLDKADPANFGKGPPSTIVSFGDEETEHKYIQGLKRLGLDTTDIDPVDPNQPAGMPRQKTDPTYNVTEENDILESLSQEFELLEDEFLGEIRMNPANLRAEAAKTGALAGMEFEMIVPGVKSDEPEPEPDYDQDERCRSIEDAVQFFHDGDFNGRREVERLRASMQQDYEEWLYEKIDEDWDRDPVEYIYQYLVRDVDAETIGEIIGQDLSDADGVTKQQLAVAADLVNDNELQPYYNDARDWHREEYNDSWDESDWLDARDLDRMSAIENNYNITWPHWNYDTESAVDIDTVANDFSEAVGMPVNASQTYHGGRREAGHYVVEPDGSLDPDDSDDMGLEFVSPPMPIDEMLDQLKKVREWAGRYGCYTNRSTGLHINVSVPEFDNDKLDYVKLALLLGDQYVLDQFGRSSNTYAKSALGMVRDRVSQNPQAAQALLDKMRGHMDDLATKAIHSGQTSKYTSINTKDGYIEFRSPGGDWLDENFDKVENTLLRFTVALKAAMDPEAYREEYLKKLYKLLEPTAQEQKGSDTVRYFADYVAGKIPAAALRSFVKQAQLQRRISSEPASGKQYWWRVYKDGRDVRNTAMIEVVASSEQEAIDKAAAEFGPFSVYKAYMDAVVLRPYVETEPEYEIFQVAGNRVVQTFRAADNNAALAYFDRTISASDRPYYDVRRAGTGTAEPAAQQPAGGFEFELSQTDIENRLGWPDQTGDANYEIVNRNTLQPVYLFIANTDQDAARKYSQIIDAMGMPGAAENYGYRARGSVMPPVDRQGTQSGSQRSAEGGNFTGNWLILDPQGREIHRFSGVGNVQSDANRVAIQWLRAHPGTMQAGVTVVPEMN